MVSFRSVRVQKYIHANTAGRFDPEAVRVLTTALDEAWQSLLTADADFRSRGHAEAMRELLALRIIEMATLGERDPHRLREDALLHLAQSNKRSTGL